MDGFGLNPDFMSPEEKLHFAMGIHPSQLGLPDSQPALPAGGQPPAPSPTMAKATDMLPAGITLPGAADAPPITEPHFLAPAIASPQLSDQGQHENELHRLQSTGSGLDQFSQRHHILGPIARIGDIAGSMLFPGQMSMIPGTSLHHQALMGDQKRDIAQDVSQDQEAAKTGEFQANANEKNAQAEALKHPKPEKTGSPEDEAFLSLVGTPNPDTGKPYTAMEAFTKVSQAKQDVKPDSVATLDKQYQDALRNGDHEAALRILQVKKDLAAAGQAPERPQKPQQQLAVIDGKVVELKPGMDVPKGAQSLTGDLNLGKPNAEELKRSEMAKNMGENLDKLEDIVKRRPELFGPLSGRVTQGKMWLGSDDPDVGALNTIKDQIGMAQQSAHSMRSAQHVEAAANSILNGFKNGPGAINSSIKTARDSLHTFTEDVQGGNPATQKPAAQASPQGGGVIYARDPQGKLHQATAGTPLPQGWKQEAK